MNAYKYLNTYTRIHTYSKWRKSKTSIVPVRVTSLFLLAKYSNTIFSSGNTRTVVAKDFSDVYIVSIFINLYSVCMYYVYMSFPQMRQCNIAPHHQLAICHNNVIVDNTFPTCFGGVQVGIQNKWNINTDMYVCVYMYMYVCTYVNNEYILIYE